MRFTRRRWGNFTAAPSHLEAGTSRSKTAARREGACPRERLPCPHQPNSTMAVCSPVQQPAGDAAEEDGRRYECVSRPQRWRSGPSGAWGVFRTGPRTGAQRRRCNSASERPAPSSTRPSSSPDSSPRRASCATTSSSAALLNTSVACGWQRRISRTISKAIGNRASVLADDAHTTAGSRSGLPIPGTRCLQGLLTPSIANAPRAARVPVAKQPCIR